MKKYWVWLSSLDKVSPINRLKLLDYFKDPKNIWEASEEELRKLQFLTEVSIGQIIDEKHKTQISTYMKSIAELGIEVITIKDEIYPFYLKNIYDPPVVLYVKGVLIQNEKSIALVGSRKATSYGFEAGEELAYQLASLGITIVSGMARGIDSSAHKGALRAKGRTIAVLGCGHDIVYPPQNKTLMEDIIENGAVISEYLPGTAPLPKNFPARNRIISGLSLGVVVVEAAENSGSLITANFALEQGREVFALPGDINRINSRGTNKLIKEGAKLTTCIEDILEELEIYNIVNNTASKRTKGNDKSYGLHDQINYKGLNNEERRIVECLMYEPMHIDFLVNMTGYSIKYINSVLTMLELKGIVEQMQGKIFKLRNQY
ncbi:MAG: DNA-protecting protein DprA [Firmicutes bacterium]|nr:DNA-protecting protein DprA [Bacillota bacterium]